MLVLLVWVKTTIFSGFIRKKCSVSFSIFCNSYFASCYRFQKIHTCVEIRKYPLQHKLMMADGKGLFVAIIDLLSVNGPEFPMLMY